MARIACFGEMMLRLTAPPGEMMLQSGHLDVYVAGAEANVAVALAALGHRPEMVTRLPDTRLGDVAIEQLRRHGVGVGGISRGPGRMGLYFVTPGAGPRPPEVLYDRRDSSFACSGAGDYDWNALLDGADLLHLSGINPALGEGPTAAANAACETAAARGVRVSFDANHRASLWEARGADPRDLLSPLIRQAEIFFGNHRDISLLLDRPFSGEGPDRRREAAEAAFAAFPNLKFIASTARHVDDASTHRLAARIDTPESFAQTEEETVAGIVDRIGSGDAFAAGILHGICSGWDLERTVGAGLAMACLKHGLSGDFAPFSEPDIEAFLAGGGDVRR
jgi:2-dehydro-3-deoxygluconokinase